jgi:hypothetical protein
MRELSVRAYLHRRDLGDASALDAARVLAIGVENPHLHAMLDQEAGSLLDDLLGKADGSPGGRGRSTPPRRAARP